MQPDPTKWARWAANPYEPTPWSTRRSFRKIGVTMHDADLIAAYIRLQEVDGETHLEVAAVDWDGPSNPVLRWTAYRRWRRPPSAEQVVAAQEKALGQPRFFRVCRLCRTLQNAGHMFDRKICQSCAETRMGIVY